MLKIWLLSVLLVFFSRGIHSELKCSLLEWTCKSGNCIALEKRCNGVKDCQDGSDELAETCSQIECNSGKSIPLEDVCDGTVDCDDGSDETAKRCSSISCPPFTFRCNYGACIDAKDTCNGVQHCADGSDEAQSLCGWNHTTTTTTIPNISAKEDDDSEKQEDCRFDPPPNVIARYKSEFNDTLQAGENVTISSSIIYSCKPKYALVGATNNVCVDGKWMHQHPICTRYCDDKIINGVTFQTSCEYGGVRIPCKGYPIRPGTRAKISCQIGYKKPANRQLPEVLICDENGEWDQQPYRCEQVCGLENIVPTPSEFNGTSYNNFAPWHVGIYDNVTGAHNLICGGTIINAKVILSAAHCFWNTAKDKLRNKSHFTVAVGKYYRYYDAKEPFPPQFLQIEEIFIPNGYKDIRLSYVNDIAVLVLADFIEFTPTIIPVCIDSQPHNKISVESNVVGRMVGWGTTDENISTEELQVADVSTTSFHQCIEQVDSKYKLLVAPDKFCISNIPAKVACASSSSGSGFTVPKIVEGRKIFSLWGISSIGLLDTPYCSDKFPMTLTNVQFYKDMISHFEAKNKPK